MSVYIGAPKLRIGRLLVTRGAMMALSTDDTLQALARHMRGDWGNVDEHDWKTNDEAVKFGGRVLSAYLTQDGVKFWIITERDRSATTILLPEEY